MRLKGKIAVVTGSGRGIGAAIARGYALEGASVVLVSRTRVQLEEQAERIQALTTVKPLIVQADVSETHEVEQIVKATLKAYGKIDILATCAGITMVSPSETLSLEDWHACLKINLDGTFLCCQKIGQHMIERGGNGKIITITSIVSHSAIPERAAYAASKGGVMQLMQNLAVEWARYNIQVNAISPGFIRTELVQELIERGVHKPEKLLARIPAGRLGEVDDIVGPAIFLASEEANYVTGTVLKVDGGWLANGYI